MVDSVTMNKRRDVGISLVGGARVMCERTVMDCYDFKNKYIYCVTSPIPRCMTTVLGSETVYTLNVYV